MAAEANKHTKESHAKGGVVQKALKFAVPLIVSVGLCWVMFRQVDLAQMVHIIRYECDFTYIWLMLLMALLPMFFRAMRWSLQLKAAGVDAPLHALVYSIMGTYAVNLVFPRLGEVWRCGYISMRQDAKFSTVFGSMVADRFADFVTVVLITLFTFVVARSALVDFVSTYPDAYRAIGRLLTSPWLWIALVVSVGCAWLFLARSKSRIALKVVGFIKGLWQGFAAIATMRHKWLWLLLTVCIWGCYFAQLAVAFNAFPMMSRLVSTHGLTVVLVCFVLTSIAMGIPSNGGIGPYQTALLFGLELFAPAGIDTNLFRTTGAAFGNVVIASQTVMLIVLGLVVFALIALERRSLGKRTGVDAPESSH